MPDPRNRVAQNITTEALDHPMPDPAIGWLKTSPPKPWTTRCPTPQSGGSTHHHRSPGPPNPHHPTNGRLKTSSPTPWTTQPPDGRGVGNGWESQPAARDSMSWLTTLPSAWPLVAFMIWPTKKPWTLRSPSTKRVHSSGLSAIRPSSSASSSPVSIASKPIDSAMAAGSPPRSTNSASTVLTWVELSAPSTSIAISAANDSAVSSPRPSDRFWSACLSAVAASAPASIAPMTRSSRPRSTVSVVSAISIPAAAASADRRAAGSAGIDASIASMSASVGRSGGRSGQAK